MKPLTNRNLVDLFCHKGPADNQRPSLAWFQLSRDLSRPDQKIAQPQVSNDSSRNLSLIISVTRRLPEFCDVTEDLEFSSQLIKLEGVGSRQSLVQFPTLLKHSLTPSLSTQTLTYQTFQAPHNTQGGGLSFVVPFKLPTQPSWVRIQVLENQTIRLPFMTYVQRQVPR